VISVGQEVEAKVIKIDQDERRIGLSLRSKPVRIPTQQSETQGNFGGVGDIFDSALEGLDSDK
jgi:ribosomal protein S1